MTRNTGTVIRCADHEPPTELTGVAADREANRRLDAGERPVLCRECRRYGWLIVDKENTND